MDAEAQPPAAAPAAPEPEPDHSFTLPAVLQRVKTQRPPMSRVAQQPPRLICKQLVGTRSDATIVVRVRLSQRVLVHLRRVLWGESREPVPEDIATGPKAARLRSLLQPRLHYYDGSLPREFSARGAGGGAVGACDVDVSVLSCTVAVNLGNPVMADVENVVVADECARHVSRPMPAPAPTEADPTHALAPVNGAYLRQVTYPDGNDVVVAFVDTDALVAAKAAGTQQQEEEKVPGTSLTPDALARAQEVYDRVAASRVGDALFQLDARLLPRSSAHGRRPFRLVWRLPYASDGGWEEELLSHTFDVIPPAVTAAAAAAVDGSSNGGAVAAAGEPVMSPPTSLGSLGAGISGSDAGAGTGMRRGQSPGGNSPQNDGQQQPPSAEGSAGAPNKVWPEYTPTAGAASDSAMAARPPPRVRPEFLWSGISMDSLRRLPRTGCGVFLPYAGIKPAQPLPPGLTVVPPAPGGSGRWEVVVDPEVACPPVTVPAPQEPPPAPVVPREETEPPPLPPHLAPPHPADEPLFPALLPARVLGPDGDAVLQQALASLALPPPPQPQQLQQRPVEHPPMLPPAGWGPSGPLPLADNGGSAAAAPAAVGAPRPLQLWQHESLSAGPALQFSLGSVGVPRYVRAAGLPLGRLPPRDGELLLTDGVVPGTTDISGGLSVYLKPTPGVLAVHQAAAAAGVALPATRIIFGGGVNGTDGASIAAARNQAVTAAAAAEALAAGRRIAKSRVPSTLTGLSTRHTRAADEGAGGGGDPFAAGEQAGGESKKFQFPEPPAWPGRGRGRGRGRVKGSWSKAMMLDRLAAARAAKERKNGPTTGGIAMARPASPGGGGSDAGTDGAQQQQQQEAVVAGRSSSAGSRGSGDYDMGDEGAAAPSGGGRKRPREQLYAVGRPGQGDDETTAHPSSHKSWTHAGGGAGGGDSLEAADGGDERAGGGGRGHSGSFAEEMYPLGYQALSTLRGSSSKGGARARAAAAAAAAASGNGYDDDGYDGERGGGGGGGGGGGDDDAVAALLGVRNTSGGGGGNNNGDGSAAAKSNRRRAQRQQQQQQQAYAAEEPPRARYRGGVSKPARYEDAAVPEPRQSGRVRSSTAAARGGGASPARGARSGRSGGATAAGASTEQQPDAAAAPPPHGWGAPMNLAFLQHQQPQVFRGGGGSSSAAAAPASMFDVFGPPPTLAAPSVRIPAAPSAAGAGAAAAATATAAAAAGVDLEEDEAALALLMDIANAAQAEAAEL